jgi:hypothetical protein
MEDNKWPKRKLILVSVRKKKMNKTLNEVAKGRTQGDEAEEYNT